MTTLELKSILVHQISEIEDVSFLKALKTILESKTDKRILSLTLEQKDEIILSKKEIKKGLYVSNTQLEKEIKTWGNSK